MLPVTLRTEPAETYRRPALSFLSELVGRIGADGDHFLIVERLEFPVEEAAPLAPEVE
ncbi:hypothetical protein ABT024_26860 [Streptomyces sp. NPDC002812]|uniref:hypothetical protein n=1 Tax=Streptomyces sp. NPDC002812 TaxID=3154434 RepID=UPI00331A9779